MLHPWGHKELDKTEWLNNNNNYTYHTHIYIYISCYKMLTCLYLNKAKKKKKKLKIKIKKIDWISLLFPIAFIWYSLSDHRDCPKPDNTKCIVKSRGEISILLVFIILQSWIHDFQDSLPKLNMSRYKSEHLPTGDK